MIKSLFHKVRRACNVPNRAEVQQLVFEEVQKSTQLLQKGLMQQRRLLSRPPAFREVPQPGNEDGVQETLEMIRRVAPEAYALWLKCQKEGEKSYEGTPVDSCSVAGHAHAELFRDFIFPYLRGSLLDVGCGPQPVPEYLRQYPLECIAGVDPIGSQADHPFPFYLGMAEMLPWPEDTFDAVVVGTSMDHFILLDRSLEEIERVLAPDGVLVVWVSFTPGAPTYDPYATGLKPFDRFHLFHFDQPWFEELVQQNFNVVERFELYLPGYQRPPEAFYALSSAKRTAKREAKANCSEPAPAL